MHSLGVACCHGWIVVYTFSQNITWSVNWRIARRHFVALISTETLQYLHDDVIKWDHFPRYWPFVRGIHRSPVNSPHKGQWHGALMLSLMCVWINSWVNNHKAGDLRRYRVHYDVSIMHLRYCVYFVLFRITLAVTWPLVVFQWYHLICRSCPINITMTS